jgi:hypothetical protein
VRINNKVKPKSLVEEIPQVSGKARDQAAKIMGIA